MCVCVCEERETERERQRQRERLRERDRETETEKDTHTEKERERSQMAATPHCARSDVTTGWANVDMGTQVAVLVSPVGCRPSLCPRRQGASQKVNVLFSVFQVGLTAAMFATLAKQC